MSEKRKYKKRSEYWGKFQKSEANLLEGLSKSVDYIPEMIGESFYQSVAATTTSGNRTEYRSNSISKTATKDRFKNIDDGILPYGYSSDFVSVRDAIELCQKAYFNIPAFRSTVDLLSEFADSEVYLEGGNAKSRAFVKAWFKRIKFHDLKAQFFREYYRSGNVFFYKLEATLKNSAETIIESYGAVNSRSPIPVKYVLLNPVDVGAKGSISFGDYEYIKILTPFEIARLRKPKTDHEKELYNSLPENVRKRLKDSINSTKDEIYLELEPKDLSAIFAKKQDYEPLAIPMVFAVLDDINKKLELKKIDQAIARSIENVVLLVTMGAEPDKGGVNERNLVAMQNIFKNKSVGRVLVSDYTTKADFVIPDLRKVVGKEKYEVLNKDIEEGLNNILIGESKYADTKLKLKIFMNRLDESRTLFLKEFLQPEIKRVCKNLGMRAWPTAKFTKTDTLDDSDLQKLVTRMMELGVLTPEQGIKTIRTGTFPEEEELAPAQKEFMEQRKDGYYLPLVNTINLYEEEAKADQQEFDNGLALKNQKTAEKAAIEKAKAPTMAPLGGGASGPKPKPKTATTAAPSGGRPLGKSSASLFSKKDIIETTKKVSEFELKAFAAFSEKYGTEKIEKDQSLISRVSESIIVAKEEKEWEDTLANVVENFEILETLNILPEILEVGARHSLDDLASAILYHSTKNSV